MAADPSPPAAATDPRRRPALWWRRRSLRGRITIAATALFTVMLVLAGLALLVTVGRSLVNTLDMSAQRTGEEVATLVETNRLPEQLLAGSGGVSQIQVVDGQNRVVAASPGADTAVSILRPEELARARRGTRLTVAGERASAAEPLRVIGVRADTPAGQSTVLVATDLGRVLDSSHLLQRYLIFGVPLAVAVMAALTWWIVGLTLRPVTALQRGAAELSAARLSRVRLPLPTAQDEIYSLATTLNTMLDRLDVATSKQRRFVGDAAHELRSPIASLRLQLEIAGRVSESQELQELTADALIDVERLSNLIDDLLALARADERGAMSSRAPVDLLELAEVAVADYRDARVPVRCVRSDVSSPAGNEAGTMAGPDAGVGAGVGVGAGAGAGAGVGTDHGATTADQRLMVVGDRDGLHRVLINLIDNAVRYARSEVTIAASGGPDAVLLTITDDGPGVPESKRERVFDRFYRLDTARSRAAGGTGLGLSIVREVITAHRGTVVLEDNEPGLRVRVALPRV